MDWREKPLRRFPTTAEISTRAGVDKSTVSRALKNDPRVKESTRQMIHSIAATLGYAPNAIAHSLATQRSNIIGFIGSETQNYWYQENIQTLARQITLAGRQMMLFQVMANGTIEDVVPDMIQYRLSGCIVIPAVAMTPRSAEKLQKFGTTVVMMNRVPVGGACAVRQDQVKGAHAVAEIFAMAGHERIALIAGNQNPAAIDREEGFRRGLAACNKSLYAREEGLFTFRDAYNAATRLFDMKRRPDAIFAANDMMAFATLEAARIKGVSVPGDISVIGYDNGRVGAWPGFRLTTVEQPIALMFESALQMILARATDETVSPETIEVQPRFIFRDSARLPQDLHGLSIGHHYAEPVLQS